MKKIEMQTVYIIFISCPLSILQVWELVDNMLNKMVDKMKYYMTLTLKELKTCNFIGKEELIGHIIHMFLHTNVCVCLREKDPIYV